MTDRPKKTAPRKARPAPDRPDDAAADAKMAKAVSLARSSPLQLLREKLMKKYH